jgi:hypothetical protein
MLSGVILVLAASLAAEQPEKPGPNYEHLKCYEALIGTWRYDGPLLEDTPEAKKGSPFLASISFGWILNKNAIEVNWKVRFEGGTQVIGKSLQGWNPKEGCVVIGSMDSLGVLEVGTVTCDHEAKTWTLNFKGVSPSGADTSSTITNILSNPDTLIWQAKERRGLDPDGESPQYEFKRQESKPKAR